MLIRHVFIHSQAHLIAVPTIAVSTPFHSPPSKFPSSVPLLRSRRQSQISVFVAKLKPNGRRTKTLEEPQQVEAEIVEGDDYDYGAGGEGFPFSHGFGEDEVEEEEDGRGSEGFYGSSGYGGGRDVEKDFDRDPEIGEILGSCFDDPQKAQTRVEERIRRKRNKVLHTKTGSATPMKITFNKFSFSNSYIWFEFYNAPLTKDITLICDTIRAWHIVGRLGGCNSMNMQLSQAPLENKRPTYDPIQGANVTPTTFYNIGDLEMQDNLARIWIDIGTSEPLLLDVLINALSCLSSDYVGIKQVVFGGTEFEGWKENMTSEDAGYSTHKI